MLENSTDRKLLEKRFLYALAAFWNTLEFSKLTSKVKEGAENFFVPGMIHSKISRWSRSSLKYFRTYEVYVLSYIYI